MLGRGTLATVAAGVLLAGGAARADVSLAPVDQLPALTIEASGQVGAAHSGEDVQPTGTGSQGEVAASVEVRGWIVHGLSISARVPYLLSDSVTRDGTAQTISPTSGLGDLQLGARFTRGATQHVVVGAEALMTAPTGVETFTHDRTDLEIAAIVGYRFDAKTTAYLAPSYLRTGADAVGDPRDELGLALGWRDRIGKLSWAPRFTLRHQLASAVAGGPSASTQLETQVKLAYVTRSFAIGPTIAYRITAFHDLGDGTSSRTREVMAALELHVATTLWTPRPHGDSEASATAETGSEPTATRRRFAVRAGFGALTGILGVGAEMWFGRLGLGAGVGTYAITGGVSISQHGSGGGLYLDVHAASPGIGVLGADSPGVGAGVTAGYDLRPRPWLTVKVGAGAAWSSKASFPSHFLVADGAAGVVF